MRWISNSYDPNKPDYYQTIIVDLHETREQAIIRDKEYLKDKIIGPPKETSTYTVAQLEEMGYIGIYIEE